MPCPKLLGSLLSTVSSRTAQGQASTRKTRGQDGDQDWGCWLKAYCGGGRSGLLPLQARQRAGRHFGGAAGFPPCLLLRPLGFCVVTLGLLRVGVRGGNGRGSCGAAWETCKSSSLSQDPRCAWPSLTITVPFHRSGGTLLTCPWPSYYEGAEPGLKCSCHPKPQEKAVPNMQFPRAHTLVAGASLLRVGRDTTLNLVGWRWGTTVGQIG